MSNILKPEKFCPVNPADVEVNEWTREPTLKWCEQQHSFLGMLQFCPSRWTQRYEGRAQRKFIIIWIPAETKVCNLQFFKTSNCYLPQIHCTRRKKITFLFSTSSFRKHVAQTVRYPGTHTHCGSALIKVISILQGLSQYTIELM